MMLFFLDKHVWWCWWH